METQAEAALASAAAELRTGDAATLLREVPDGAVDLLLTDPPYNLAGYSTGNIHASWRKTLNNDVAGWDAEPFEPGAWADELCRVLSPTGTLFAFTAYNLLGQWHATLDHRFDTFQFVVWHKTNPPPKLRRAGFLNACELIIACWNRGHTWNFTKQAEMHNHIEAPVCAGKERLREPFHPTQKPLRVLRRLVELASDPGDLVCDPFAGVASTGVAAVELGRRFLGFELDEGYAAAGRARLAAAHSRIAEPG